MLEFLVWQDAPILLSCVLFLVAAFLGAAPERILTGTLFALTAMEWLRVTMGHHHMASLVDLVLLGACATALLIMVTVAIHANRLYPIVLSSAQLAKVICQSWHLKLGAGAVCAHAMANASIFLLQLIVSTAGLVFHLKRLPRQGGEYPAWTEDAPLRSST